MRSFLENLYANFRLADALDILIITVLLYGVIAWFRDRAARSLMIMAAAAGAIYLLARWLEMYLTTMLFEVGFIVVVVTFAIVFQQDIRRGFERLAAAGWPSRSQPASPKSQAVEVLTESLVHLAEQRTGALLIFPGHEPLGRHLRGGVAVDALISMPLLCSIFNPESPGHDGAVLIEAERVERLGIHLPLSHNLDEVGVGGTRHTAALGLAERSDALVVAVSEERGTITVAHEGQLKEVDSTALVKTLQDWYGQGAQPRRTTRDKPLRTIGLKLVVLATACLLWLVFAFETESIQRTLVVPIEYRNVPENWVVDEPRATRAELTLTGPEKAFQLLDPTSVSVSLDLADVDPQRSVLLRTNRSVKNIPTELTINQIEPSNIRLRLRRIPASPESE